MSGKGMPSSEDCNHVCAHCGTHIEQPPQRPFPEDYMQMHLSYRIGIMAANKQHAAEKYDDPKRALDAADLRKVQSLLQTLENLELA